MQELEDEHFLDTAERGKRNRKTNQAEPRVHDFAETESEAGDVVV